MNLMSRCASTNLWQDRLQLQSHLMGAAMIQMWDHRGCRVQKRIRRKRRAWMG